MAPKAWCEQRTRRLFAPYLAYQHVCPDHPHSGAVKLDLIGLLRDGRFLAVETKQVATLGAGYRPIQVGAGGLSPLQRQALDEIAAVPSAAVAVAVWAGADLWLFDWRRWREQDRWPQDGSYFHRQFRRWREWHAALWMLLPPSCRQTGHPSAGSPPRGACEQEDIVRGGV